MKDVAPETHGARRPSAFAPASPPAADSFSLSATPLTRRACHGGPVIRRARLAILLGLLAAFIAGPTAGADEPERVSPPSGTVEQLRAAVSAASQSLGEALDKSHDWLYRRMQYVIQDFDSWFTEGDQPPVVVPVSPIRIGVDGALLHGREGFGLVGTRDFSATLRIPNVERRLNVFISNDDLTESPNDPALARAPVRAGLRFAPIPHLDVEFGVRAKIWPSAFGAVRWTSDFSAGALRVYPFAKTYVETGLGLGVSGGVAIDRWSGHWVLRSASYADWVRNTAATDWSQSVLVGYAKAVIQQRSYDRLADGHDLACGVVARLSVNGDRISRTTLYEASVLYKRPLHGGWLFGYAGPLVRWNRDYRWHPDVGVGIGFDALFWGLATRPAEIRNYCR